MGRRKITRIDIPIGVTQSNISKIEMRGDPALSVRARMAEAKGKRLTLSIEADDGVVEERFALG